MDGNNIKLYENKHIRSAWDEGKQEWYLSVSDVVAVLTDSKDVKQYIKKMRSRDPELNSSWGTICTPTVMTASDGKKYRTNAANAEGILRIIQSIPSPKAEPFKVWLARVGSDRIDETIDPELTIDRALGTYMKKENLRDNMSTLENVIEGVAEESDKNIAVIILAAGYSSRMGKFKALLPIDNRPAISILIEAVKKSGIQDIIIVTGYEREKLIPVIEGYNVVEAYNPEYDSGMFSSIKRGLMEIRKTDRSCFLLPVDTPLIQADVLNELINAADSELAVPTYRGKKGHPLYIPREMIGKILSYEGSDGLKGITDKYFDRIKRIPVDNEGIVMDMDDPESYEAIKAFAAGGLVSDDPVKLAAGRTLYLIRHGQIKQHEKKIFLGQTDVSLSEQGKAEAVTCAEKLSGMLKSNEEKSIYTSPLLRAKETADIIARSYIDQDRHIKLIEVPGFAEMSLGEWDGKFIDAIKEKYPDTYKKRGENLWIFKTGNNSENFYDLQYRVIKALCHVLKKDNNRNIVIVSHKGVLRAIENNLAGKSIDDDWCEMKIGEIRIIRTSP